MRGDRAVGTTASNSSREQNGRGASQSLAAPGFDGDRRPVAFARGQLRFQFEQFTGFDERAQFHVGHGLQLPIAAVLRRGELTAVYVASGVGFVLKAVRLGADHGAEGVEVVAGLVAGDRVALEPVKAGLVGAQAVAPAAGVK